MPRKLIIWDLVAGWGWASMAATRVSSGRMPSAVTCCPRKSTEEAKNTHFSRRYIRGAASILKPLTDATRGVGGKHSKLVWTKEMVVAFTATKVALREATHLAHPHQEAELSLAVDASNHHVGAAMQQAASPRR